MWLLDKMLKALIREGRLTITDHDGKVYQYGPGGGDAIPMTRDYIHEESARLRASDTPPAWHLAPEAQQAAE